MSSYYAQYVSALTSALQTLEVTDETGTPLDPEEGFSRLCERTRQVQRAQRCMFFVGNGASAAMASHMATDWLKNGGVRSFAFNDSALSTAFANDTGYENVFAGPLMAAAMQGDLLVAISSSGKSPSVVKALEAGRKLDLFVVTFSGFSPQNPSRRLGHLNLFVPSRTYGIAETAHQALLHAWLDRFMGVSEWT